jgi:hypothetical protein
MRITLPLENGHTDCLSLLVSKGFHVKATRTEHTRDVQARAESTPITYACRVRSSISKQKQGRMCVQRLVHHRQWPRANCALRS